MVTEGQEGLVGMVLSSVLDLSPVIGGLFKRKVPHNLGMKIFISHTATLNMLLKYFTWGSFEIFRLKAKFPEFVIRNSVHENHSIWN